MAISFQCEHCGRQVQAPGAAAGKRGKCPYCDQSMYIPAPVDEEDLVPLAPLDEEQERQRQAELQELLRQQHDLIAELGSAPQPPLEQREDLAPEDVYHFVVNYCLDLADSNLERAETHVARLREFGEVGREAVEDFLGGRAAEPALDSIPRAVLRGFLSQLQAQLGEAQD